VLKNLPNDDPALTTTSVSNTRQDVSFTPGKERINKRAGTALHSKKAKKAISDQPLINFTNPFQPLGKDEDFDMDVVCSSDDDEPCSSKDAIIRASRKSIRNK